MNKDRIRQICERVLGISYSGITICHFDMTPTFKYDETLSKWVPNSFALFIQITSSSENPTKVQERLESALGFECCVDFV